MVPIRILHVVTYMQRGGLETMLMNYYRHIDRSQIQFDFLVHREFRADYDDEIEFLGGKIYRLPRLVPWSPSYHKALDNFFTEHPEYTVIHVHQDCLSSVILKAAKKHGVPIRLAHSHCSSQDKNLKYPIKLFCMRSIPKYATQLFACGQKAGDWMFRGAPYTVLNNAIDAKQYVYDASAAQTLREQLGISNNDLVIGHVGRFMPQKNHDFLIDIFKALLDRVPQAKLLLVGGGDLMDNIRSKVRDLALEGSVIFTGVRSDIPALLQVMDVFVLPSLYEGLPVTLIEAQASGLPCVISDQVSPECVMIEQIQFVSLDSSADEWATHILRFTETARENTYNRIVAAGYDIIENAQWLSNYYMEMVKNNE